MASTNGDGPRRAARTAARTTRALPRPAHPRWVRRTVSAHMKHHTPTSPFSLRIDIHMHTAHQQEPNEHARAHRRSQHPMARPSRAPAAQTRAPARCAARNAPRRASPTPPACFPLRHALPSYSRNSARPLFGFLNHRGGWGVPVGVALPPPSDVAAFGRCRTPSGQ
jgi:hypothetical protein